MNNPTLESCDRLAEIKLKLDDEYNRISWLLDEAEDDVRWLINELEQSIPKERLLEFLHGFIAEQEKHKNDSNAAVRGAMVGAYTELAEYIESGRFNAITSGSMEGKG